MENKKYLLTDESVMIGERTLYRIQATRNFGNVKCGELGGWVESEENLSHEGECWIYNEAKVLEEAIIKEDARIFNHSTISGKAQVFGQAAIFDFVKVSGDTKIFDKARLFENATISEGAKVFENAMIFDQATISGEAKVFGKAKLLSQAKALNGMVINRGVIIH